MSNDNPKLNSKKQPKFFNPKLRKNVRRYVGRNDPCPCGSKTSEGKPKKFKNCCDKRYRSGELQND